MSINLVTLNHWVWSYLNADMAGTYLNNRNFFSSFFLPFKFHQFSFPPDPLLPPQPASAHTSTFKARYGHAAASAAVVCSL